MSDTPPSDRLILQPVMLKQPSQHRWLKASWSLLGTLPGLTQSALDEAGQQGELIKLPPMTVKLHRQFCEAYYLNLMADQAKIYLICQQSDEPAPTPLLLSVDFDEAAAYMEAAEPIFEAPLTDELCVWLERYVVAYYQPQKLKKRKRRRWTDETER